MTRPYREPDRPELDEAVPYRFELSRRGFVQALGAGLLVTVLAPRAAAQRGSSESGGAPVAARLHIGEDGVITVMTGKVEFGQGSRTQISQAAAEELRVPLDQIALVMADTDLVPDDGGTFGSRTTPSTIPDVRRGATAARELLLDLAAARLGVSRDTLRADKGAVTDGAGKSVTFAELARTDEFKRGAARPLPDGIALTPVREWTIMGTPQTHVHGRSIVTGAHKYPSDIARPGMLYGKVLRPERYNARLVSVDFASAEALDGVTVVRDGDFVGCAAPTSWQAAKALEAIALSASWEAPEGQPSSQDLFAYLKAHPRTGDSGGRGGRGTTEEGSIDDGLRAAKTTVEAAYEVAYIQHVPMEPRAAVAEWEGGRLTVWTGTQRPDGVRDQLAEAFSMAAESVRVIVPDTGGGFGGKHTGEAAIEAARLAKAAGKPVSLRWTREEEFRWAYFRPAALIEAQAGLDAGGSLTAWQFVNYNAGTAGIGCPYRTPNRSIRHVPCDSPLRTGSYRALAATANNFARECFIDECAVQAGMDPLAFRLANLDDPRIKAVLEAAAAKFGWRPDRARTPNNGCGLACGTEKGSVVAACVEVEVDRTDGSIRIQRIVEAFECGPIHNPTNLNAQVRGAIVMGLGGALTEAVEFDDGRVTNARLRDYRVPHFRDIPPIELELLNRPDLPAVGAGETPIIALAPAIANAVYDAAGIRIRTMPIRSDALRTA